MLQLYSQRSKWYYFTHFCKNESPPVVEKGKEPGQKVWCHCDNMAVVCGVTL